MAPVANRFNEEMAFCFCPAMVKPNPPPLIRLHLFLNSEGVALKKFFKTAGSPCFRGSYGKIKNQLLDNLIATGFRVARNGDELPLPAIPSSINSNKTAAAERHPALAACSLLGNSGPGIFCTLHRLILCGCCPNLRVNLFAHPVTIHTEGRWLCLRFKEQPGFKLKQRR